MWVNFYQITRNWVDASQPQHAAQAIDSSHLASLLSLESLHRAANNLLFLFPLSTAEEGSSLCCWSLCFFLGKVTASHWEIKFSFIFQWVKLSTWLWRESSESLKDTSLPQAISDIVKAKKGLWKLSKILTTRTEKITQREDLMLVTRRHTDGSLCG